MKKGLFVTLEGPDGSGKTTVLHGLAERLQQANIDAVITREPGGTPLAEKIRTLILDVGNREMSARCEALLYAASRAQHTQERIRPALEAGRMVLCDRYVLSSLAYQGAGRGLGVQEVFEINQFATQSLEPDLILFFSIDPTAVLERKARTVAQDRLERAGAAFHQRVYEGYQEALSLAKNVHRVDATQSIEEVLEESWQTIQKYWEERS